MTDIVEQLEKFGSKWPYDAALAEIKSLRQQLAECQATSTLDIPDVIRQRRWQREALLERADYYDSIPGYEAFGGTIADELREKAKELE